MWALWSNGHKETVCNAKKAGKPRVLFSAVDGGQVYANMIRAGVVNFPNVIDEPMPEAALEKFYADTGANQSIHPSARSATPSSYSRLTLDFTTAAQGKSMRSEGVGAMELYTADGQ